MHKKDSPCMVKPARPLAENEFSSTFMIFHNIGIRMEKSTWEWAVINDLVELLITLSRKSKIYMCSLIKILISVASES